MSLQITIECINTFYPVTQLGRLINGDSCKKHFFAVGLFLEREILISRIILAVCSNLRSLFQNFSQLAVHLLLSNLKIMIFIN